MASARRELDQQVDADADATVRNANDHYRRCCAQRTAIGHKCAGGEEVFELLLIHDGSREKIKICAINRLLALKEKKGRAPSNWMDFYSDCREWGLGKIQPK